MAIDEIADQYFTYDSRFASFQTAQPVSKRRASNASSKAPKAIKWPHKSLSPETLAKAGFFFHPSQANPDNVACFLCHRSLDGWEEDDDPLAEHLKHSPDCGWAIVASIEQRDEELSQEYPASSKMIEARKATFGNHWPHEGKKGWKCKTKQMVDAGWKYTPTPEYDDMATCTYCALALDGWEPSDKPMDEHYSRSPDCPFFRLVSSYKQETSMKKSKSKRASKASRLSTQSVLTVASEAPSYTDLPAEEDDSIITTATNATTSQGKKMPKAKKAMASKTKKTRAKKGEPVEIMPAPEPEDYDVEVKVDTTPKAVRGKKRKSEEEESIAAHIEAPPAKRRATRTRGSVAVNELVIADESSNEVSKPAARKGRPSKATRKASAASVAPLRANIPDDDELDQALEADLQRPLTDDEGEPGNIATFKKSTRQSKITNSDHAMFNPEPMEIDEAAIEAELEAMEVESKPLPKAKGAKGKQPRKVSAKQQAAAAKKAAEAEAQRLAEEQEASQQVVAELEHSISMQQSSPIIQPKKQRASRQLVKQRTGRATRGSVMPATEDTQGLDSQGDTLIDQADDSGHETDASMASQSTIVRGGSTQRGSTLKKGRVGKKAASRHIEEIVHHSPEPVIEASPEPAVPSPKGKGISFAEEVEYSVPETIEEESIQSYVSKPIKGKTAKPRGRPPKASAASTSQVRESDLVLSVEEEEVPAQPTPIQYRAPSPPRLSSPPPKDLTPSQSPQSSDAENHPPSSKPSDPTKKTVTPQSHTRRIPLADSTPQMSPSKRNVIAGLQSTHPWTSADLDLVFMKSPEKENAISSASDLFGAAAEKAKNGDLTSPEKTMTVEEWIKYNAEIAEEKLRSECERMVGAFEREGTRAMAALEGVECID